MANENGRRRFVLSAVVAAAGLAGCKSPAEKVVAGYLGQKNCADRAQFILEPEKYKNDLITAYKDRSDCVAKHEGIDASACKSIPVGEYCTVAVKKASDYCVKRVAEGEFKIDWPCSTGWSEKPLKVVKADEPGPDKPALVRVYAELDDGYFDGTSRDTEVSLRLTDDTDTAVFFAAKSRVLKATGKTLEFENTLKLKKLLDDGKKHKVTVEIGYLKRKDKDSVPMVAWFIQDGWRSIPDADLEKARKEMVAATTKWLEPGKADADKVKACCAALEKLVKGGDEQPATVRFAAARMGAKCVLAQAEVLSGDAKLDDAGREIDRHKRFFDVGDHGDKYPKECGALVSER